VKIKGLASISKPEAVAAWVKTLRSDSSLKGCQIVAGGRSVAQTTGQQSKIIPHPERVSGKQWHPSGVRTTWALLSGGLRYAATTGYYLTALQAEIRSLRFPKGSVATGSRL
jgi:hypothetical protein